MEKGKNRLGLGNDQEPGKVKPEESNQQIRRWPILSRVLLFYIGTVVILATVAPMAPRGPWLSHLLFIGAVSSMATLILTLLFTRWERLSLEDVGIRFNRHSALSLAIGFLIGLGFVVLHTLLAWGAGHIRWTMASDFSLLDGALILLGFLLVSAREELAFHGYSLHRLKAVSGFGFALFITSLAFALEHRASGSPWEQALFGAGIGCLLFGMAAIASRGVALPIGLHAAWNFGDSIRGGKGPGGIWTTVVENGFEEQTMFWGMVSYVLVMGLATLAFWWWYRLSNRRMSPAIELAAVNSR